MPRSPSFFNPSAANSPVMQAYASDPRQALAQSLIAAGSNARPVNSPIEGLARLASALVGAYQSRQLGKEYQERQGRYGETLEQGLRAAAPWNAPDDVMNEAGTGVVVPKGQQAPGTGGLGALAAVLAGNPDTAPMAAEMRISDFERKQGITDETEADRRKAKLTAEFRAPTSVAPGAKLIGADGNVVAEGGPKEPAPDVAAYQFAKTPEGGSFTGTFEAWKRAGVNNGQEQFGNTPVWGTDAQGNSVLMQTSSRGGLKPLVMPAGVTPQRGQTSRVDLGTEWGILDATGALIGRLPKDVAGEKLAEVTGAGAGTAIVDANKKGTSAVNTLDALNGVEDLIKKATGSGLGQIRDSANAFVGRSNPSADAIAQLQVLQGNLMATMPRMEGPQSNLDVKLYEKNAGQIGNPSVPETQKLAAVKEIRRLQEKYRDRAGQPPAVGQAPAAPSLTPAEQDELKALRERFGR